MAPDCSSQSDGVTQAVSDRNDARRDYVTHKNDVYDPAVTARNEAIQARKSAQTAFVAKNAKVAEALAAYDAEPSEANAELLAAARTERNLAAGNLDDARLAATDRIAEFEAAAAERSTLFGTFAEAKSDLADARTALDACQNPPLTVTITDVQRRDPLQNGNLRFEGVAPGTYLVAPITACLAIPQTPGVNCQYGGAVSPDADGVILISRGRLGQCGSGSAEFGFYAPDYSGTEIMRVTGTWTPTC